MTFEDEPDITDEKLLLEAKEPPSWICACGATNADPIGESPLEEQSCTQCGRPRLDGGKTREAKTYRSLEELNAGAKVVTPRRRTRPIPEPPPVREFSIPRLPFAITVPMLIGAALAIAFVIFVGFMIKLANHREELDATVTAVTWSRTVVIKETRTYRRTGTSIPPGGRKVSERTYDDPTETEPVLVGYKDGIINVPITVVVGKEKCNFKDTGTGITEYEWCDKTAPSTKPMPGRVPVYEDRPKKKTEYTYDIDEDVEVDTLVNSGTSPDPAPSWPTYTLAEKQQAYKTEKYLVYFSSDKVKEFPQHVWETFHKGDNVTLVFNGFGMIVEVKR